MIYEILNHRCVHFKRPISWYVFNCIAFIRVVCTICYWIGNLLEATSDAWNGHTYNLVCKLYISTAGNNEYEPAADHG